MIPLDTATPANQITGFCIGVLGLVSLAVALRWRYQHPPMWTLRYRGRGSFMLAHIFLACWCLTAFGMPLQGNVPDAVALGILVFWPVTFVAWVIGTAIWFPRFLTPRWYREARRAGVDVHDPLAVEAFRQQPRHR